MNLFYSTSISGKFHTLSVEESKHCIRVMRLKKGDKVHLTDGLGNLFETIIADNNFKNCVLEIIQVHSDFGKMNFNIHLAVAPTKNLARFEWFLEKATEIGIDCITPILCEHSERKVLNADRLNKIVISAMKQSLKTFCPILNPMMEFHQFITQEFHSTKFIAHCDNQNKNSLHDVYRKGNDVVFLIGPEGGFSNDEINGALQAGFVLVGLGNSRLRTETAAISACVIINFLNQ